MNRRSRERADAPGTVAFVLGGGGVLGATQVGMLRALLEAGIRPDLIVGTSVGAVNGAVFAADPTAAGVGQLAQLWASMSDAGMFSDTVLSRATTLARHRTHLYSPAPFRQQLEEHLPADFTTDIARASAGPSCEGSVTGFPAQTPIEFASLEKSTDGFRSDVPIGA